jgi:hypothetical protein
MMMRPIVLRVFVQSQDLNKKGALRDPASLMMILGQAFGKGATTAHKVFLCALVAADAYLSAQFAGLRLRLGMRDLAPRGFDGYGRVSGLIPDPEQFSLGRFLEQVPPAKPLGAPIAGPTGSLGRGW